MRYRDARVIGPDGQQIGILQTRQALDLARAEGLDLVMVSPNSVPPVCKIIDFGKYKYETEKLQKESRRKQQDVKGIKLRPGTAPHDIQILLRNSIRFLSEGHKVRVTCQFRAREVTHPEIGLQKMQAFAEALADYAILEKPPTLDGKLMTMVLSPRPGKVKHKDAKDQDEQDGQQAVQVDRLGEDHAEAIVQQSHVLPQERQPETTP